MNAKNTSLNEQTPSNEHRSVFRDPLAPLERYLPYALLLLRVVTAYLFIQHGTAKLFSIPYVEGMAGAPLASIYGVAAILEVVGGLLVLTGTFTRIAAFILSGEMAVAYFLGHVSAVPGTFHIPLHNGGEVAILFCFIFLLFAAAGAGKFSVDHYLAQK